MWHEAPLSQITGTSLICQASAFVPHVPGPSKLPGASQMKASCSSPLRPSSLSLPRASASQAKTVTMLAHIFAKWPFPPQTLHTCPGHRTVLWPTSPQRLHFALPPLPPSTFLLLALLFIVGSSFYSPPFSPPFTPQPPRPCLPRPLDF